MVTKIYNKKFLRENLNDDEIDILNAGFDADLDYFLIAACIIAFREYDYSKKELIDAINSGKVKESYETKYGNVADVDGTSFLVIEEYSDVVASVKEWYESQIDDVGLPNIVLDWENYVDMDILGDICYELCVDYTESYCKDCLEESSSVKTNFENRLIEECYNNDIIFDEDFEQVDGEPDYSKCLVSDDDLIEQYVSWYINDCGIIDWVEEYRNIFGQESLDSLLEEEIETDDELFDLDSFVSSYLDFNDAGTILSSYDGNELEFDLPAYNYSAYVYRLD